MKAACESEDEMLTAAILDSADIRLPNGTLRLAYDELGNMYKIPAFCLTFPDNMLDDRRGAVVYEYQLSSPSYAQQAHSCCRHLPIKPAPPSEIPLLMALLLAACTRCRFGSVLARRSKCRSRPLVCLDAGILI